MRVYLISANTEQINMPVLPVGLACVAAAVENAGHEVRFLNLMTGGKSLDAVDRDIGDFRPEVIGISVRNIDDQCMRTPRFLLDPVKEVVARCRGLSHAPIVLGGAGFSIFPHGVLEYVGADMGIRGEGEAAFVMLLDRLAAKTGCSDVPGLITAGGQSENRQDRIMDLDRFPLPAANGCVSFPTTFGNQKIWLPIQTRRGCPMECSYCSTAAIEGRVLRRRSPDRVVDSISGLVEAGFEYFFFVDNTFNMPASYAKALCDSIIARKLDIKWRCILYPWKVDEELVDKMARAGCIEVGFGFESGSGGILRSMNKRFQPDDVRRISRILGRSDISRMGFLLLGGPGETRETVQESLAFADSLNLEAMKVTVGIRIYPHTKLARMAIADGTVAPDSNLLHPTFYLARGLDGWIQEVTGKWMGTRPHWHP